MTVIEQVDTVLSASSGVASLMGGLSAELYGVTEN